ncbi:MAG: hypothetical protein AB3N64_10685 [Puniceicoccaceae bacterium]
MKIKTAITTLSACLIAGALSAQIITALEYWTFDSDSSGAGLRDATNSGSWGSSWNFNTTSFNDIADGAGLFVLAGDSGTTTRKLPDALGPNDANDNNIYDAPVTTGKYILSVNFNSWNMDAASVGDTWKLAVNDSGGSNSIAQIIWNVQSDSVVRVRGATSLDSGSAFREVVTLGLASATSVEVSVEFDFDLNTVRYLVDGVETHSFSDFNGTDIGQLVYVKSGAWAGAANSVSVDEMGLSVVVPEAGTFAFLTGLLALGFVFYRRTGR